MNETSGISCKDIPFNNSQTDAVLRGLSSKEVSNVSNVTSAWIVYGFKIASNLFEPACKVHEHYWSLPVLHKLHPATRKTDLVALKTLTWLKIGGYALLATLTVIPAIIVRNLTAAFNSTPYICLEGDAKAKNLGPDNFFTIYTQNMCLVAGGYPITDGGVAPAAFRIDPLVKKIKGQNTDVFCGYEVFDTLTALELYEKLKDTYRYFYFNIGHGSIGVSIDKSAFFPHLSPYGVSSGMFVASKFPVKNPEFTQFPLDALYGRAKWAAKGDFRLTLQNEFALSFATISTTHLQHPEMPKQSKPGEKDAKKNEMEIIKSKLTNNICEVLTGDFNMDEAELEENLDKNSFSKLSIKDAPKKTWGGDKVCADLVGKESSDPMDLDYTFGFQNGYLESIEKSLVDVGFDGTNFDLKALSDHNGIVAKVTFKMGLLQNKSCPFLCASPKI